MVQAEADCVLFDQVNSVNQGALFWNQRLSALVGRTSWEGGKRKVGRLTIVVSSAPPLSSPTKH